MNHEEALRIFEDTASQVDPADREAFERGVAERLGLTAWQALEEFTADEEPADNLWFELSPAR